MKRKIYLFMLALFTVGYLAGCGSDSSTTSSSSSGPSFPQELGTSAD